MFNSESLSLETKIVSYILFQIAWFMLVIMHNSLACILTLPILAGLYYIIFDVKYIANIGLIALLGILVDSTWGFLGIMQYGNTISPITNWLTMLWLFFAAMFPIFANWLKKTRWYFWCLIGGLGGAISYTAGMHFGAVTYSYTVPYFIFVFAYWVVLFPALFWIYQRKLIN